MKKVLEGVLLISILVAPIRISAQESSSTLFTDEFFTGLFAGGIIGLLLSNFYRSYFPTLAQRYHEFKSFRYKMEAFAMMDSMKQEILTDTISSPINDEHSVMHFKNDLDIIIQKAREYLICIRKYIKHLSREFRSCGSQKHEECYCDLALLEKFETLEVHYSALIPSLERLSNTIQSSDHYQKKVDYQGSIQSA